MKKLNQIILIILSNLLFIVCTSNTKHEEKKIEKKDSVAEAKKFDDENKIEKNNSLAEAESFDDNIYYETVSKLSDSLNQNINIDALL